MAIINSDHIGVIILAAGKSTRFNSNKISHTINDKPMLLQVVNTFSSILDNIYIITNIAFTHKKCIISQNPMGERNDSIRKGLSLLKPQISKVIIHDAARPYITQSSIIKLINASQQHLLTQYYLPITNGLINEISNRHITVERSTLKQLCTPLIIDRALAFYIYNFVIDKKTHCYEPIEFISSYNIRPMLVRGNQKELHKITYEDDL